VAIRVALGEDSMLVREGLRQVLAQQPQIDVVAACEDMPSLLAAIESERPDVVLTDIRMPPSNTDEGIQVATRLRQTRPEVGVIVLSQYADPVYALSLLQDSSDGRGYLLKERLHDPEQLRTAIETVAAGGSVIDPKIVEALVDERSRTDRSPLAELTARELEVLKLVARGLSNAEIAKELFVSDTTVKTHVAHLLTKLGVRDRVQAVVLAYECGLAGGDEA
jgi:DNA-binding NarL/FixJ family response regulator